MNVLRRRLQLVASSARDDAGYNLTEMIVTLIIAAVFFAVATTLVIRVLQQNAAERNTLQGVQQAQIAERTFGQYLRSAIGSSITVSNSGDDLAFASDLGTTGTSISSTTCPTESTVKVNGNSYTPIAPCVEGIEAMLCPLSTVANMDSIEIIFGLSVSASDTVDAIHECIGNTGTSGPTCPIGSSGTQCGPSGTIVPITSLSPSTIRLVQSFDVLAPSASTSLFSFYTLSSETTGGKLQPILSSALTTSAVQSSPSSVEAIAMVATFEPAPGPNTGGYQAEKGTTINTVAFLRNSAGL